MCCFVNTGLSVLWHLIQSEGTSSFNRTPAWADACALWQVRHPLSTGACLNFSFLTVSPISLWQPKQSSFPAFGRLNLLFAAWGSWQFTQLPSRTALWTLRALSGITALWHWEQILPTPAARSLPWEEVWGLWQPEQFP